MSELMEGAPLVLVVRETPDGDDGHLQTRSDPSRLSPLAPSP